MLRRITKNSTRSDGILSKIQTCSLESTCQMC